VIRWMRGCGDAVPEQDADFRRGRVVLELGLDGEQTLGVMSRVHSAEWKLWIGTCVLGTAG
jgi:hypothetical protein